MLKRFWIQSLMARLVIYFLLLSIATVSVVSYIAFVQAREALKESVFERLDAVATLKANELNVWVNDQVRDVVFIAQIPAISTEGYILTSTSRSSPTYPATARSLRANLRRTLVHRPEVQELLLLNLDGTVIISSNDEHTGTSLANTRYYKAGMNLLFASSSYVENISISPETNKPVMSVVVPVFNTYGQRYGLLVAHLYVERVNRIILDRTGLGESGETYLVNSSYQFVSESRFRKQIFVSPQGVHTDGIDAALQQKSGVGLYENYDGVPVIGVYQWLSERDLALLAEISQAEAFAPAHQLARTILLIGILSVSVLAVGVYALARQIARPILEITRTALLVSKGDLSSTAPVLTKDEVGILAQVFNQMIDQLRVLYEGLEKSEKKYRAIFEESRDTIFIATPEGHIVDVNPAGANLFGYSKEDIVFIPIQKFFAYSHIYDQFSDQLQQKGTIHDFEMQLCQRGSKQLDCLITATVRREESGDLLYQGIIRDITEYKQTVRERVRLSAIEHELVLAKDIQKSLLLPPEPDWAQLDMICYNQPAYEMSGDFYAYYEFEEAPSGEQRYAIAVGDISGKGMSAALLMGISLALFQSSVHHGHSPAQLLTLLNETITPYTQSNQSNCALCQVEITLQSDKTGFLSVSNGGCIPPFIKHTNGQVDMLDVGGAPLGTTLGSLSGYSEVGVQIRPGDIIVLVSDGIIEAHNAKARMFGFDMMEKAIATGPTHSAHAMLGHIKKTLAEFVGEAEPHDDITVIVARYPG